jgi:hypothetical protein
LVGVPGIDRVTTKDNAIDSITIKKLSPSLEYLYLGACQNNGTLCYLPTEKASLELPYLHNIKLDGLLEQCRTGFSVQSWFP